MIFKNTKKIFTFIFITNYNLIFRHVTQMYNVYYNRKI